MMSNTHTSYRRPYAETLAKRLAESRRFIQILAGPRQVGKTTLVLEVVNQCTARSHYATADEPMLRDAQWLEQQWNIGRVMARESGEHGAVLVIDEIQKVDDWSEVVKRLWDADTRAGSSLKVVLLVSSPLLVRRGLTESLAGRFETIRLPHWSFAEMRDAFGWSLDDYVLYGGYPGAAALISDHDRWASYIRDAIIEPTIARDILLRTDVRRPALMRRLFELACEYSGQILSYNKMLGQLQDSGNTVTLAHYLDLLGSAGMVCGLQKHGSALSRRSSSPKLQPLNTALLTAVSGRNPEHTRLSPDRWGRLVESAVGAHLVNWAFVHGHEISYWRGRNREVDFVVQAGPLLAAIEVKSGQATGTLPGMAAFDRQFQPDVKLLVGADGIPVDEFLAGPVDRWLTAAL